MIEQRQPDPKRTEPGQPSPPLLLERERELEQVRAAIAAARAGNGSTVGIEGPPGIGKSLLLESVMKMAREEGMRVLSARSGELEQRSSWGVVRELFIPILDETGSTGPLLTGAAELSLPVLFTDEARKRPGDDTAGSALLGIYWLTSNLCEKGPLLIAVDDLHWTDPPSLRTLAYLARRVADLPLVIVLAGRPGSKERRQLIDHAQAAGEVLHPEPLSEAATATVLDRVLGIEPDPDLIHVCNRVTGGNPFLLRELSLELRRQDAVAAGNLIDRARDARPEAIRRTVLMRLAPLAEGAELLAVATTVLGRQAGLADTAALAGLTIDEAARFADELAAASILERDLPLRFRHPIMRTVVYEDVPTPARRDQLHRRAMEILNRPRVDPEIPATHALAIRPRGEAATVAVLRSAAAHAMSRGAPAGAVTYLRRALQEPPPEQQLAAVLAALGEAELVGGKRAALGHIEEALALMDRGTEQGNLLPNLGRVLYAASRLPEAAEAFERGLEQIDPTRDPDLHAKLSTALLGVSALLREPEAAGNQATEVEPLADPDIALSRAQRQLLVQRAVAAVFRAEPHRQVRAFAIRALGDGEMLDEPGLPLTFTMAISCLFWSGALEAAERFTEMALRHARDTGNLLSVAHLTFGRSQPRYWMGHAAAAAADAGAAVNAWRDGLEMHLPLAGHWCAVSLVELGDLAGAAEVLDTSIPQPGAAPIYEAFWRMGKLRLSLAAGDFESG